MSSASFLALSDVCKSMENRKCMFLATCSLVITRARANKLVGFFAIFELNFELEFDK